MFIKDNKVYDVTKWIALVLLPAAGTFYAALGAIWAFDNIQAVTGTILAVDTFLGMLIHVSNSSYQASEESYDGHMDVTVKPDGTKVANLNPTVSADMLLSKDTLKFKVNTIEAPMPVQPTAQQASDEVEHNGY